ncbi:MAG: PD-(D/E)XK nuclease-like domain-containing protein [Ramlibacter sp.]
MDQWISLEEALKDVRALAQAAFTAYECSQGKEAESVLFPKMPATVYHADRDALSCSMLKPLLISPAHFQASLVATGSSSAAKDFGSLVHLLLLEPELINNEVAVYPGIGSARDREYKKFQAANSHRLAVDEPTLASARRLVQKVANTLFRGRPLIRFIEESMTECSMYFTEPVTGLRLRVRFDAYHPDFSFDLKTTRHATPAAFARDAIDFGYDLQAYMYSLARRAYEGRTEAAPFVFITAETATPHSVCIHTAGSTFLENGAAKLRECLATFKACTTVAHWPDLSCQTTLEISPWQQFVPGQEWRGGAEAELP